MKCQNCGANVENAQVCPNCGTILQAGNSTSQQIPTIIINNVNKMKTLILMPDTAVMVLVIRVKWSL